MCASAVVVARFVEVIPDKTMVTGDKTSTEQTSQPQRPRWRIIVLGAAALGVPLLVGLASSLAYVPFGRPYVSTHEGRAAFASNCSQCHNVASGAPSGMGPNLANIGRDAATRRSGTSATEYLIESIVRPAAFQASGTGRMPNVANKLSDETLRHLVAYLSALGGKPDYEAISLTDIEALRPAQSSGGRTLDVAQAERGKRIFLGVGKCSECHTLKRTTESGLIAPMVRNMAMHDAPYLRESIVDPDKVIADTYKRYTIVTSDGKVHTGRVMRRDKERLVLLTVDSAGKMQPVSISLADIATGENGKPQIAASEISVMPKPQLTPDQIEDLIAFLTSSSDMDQAF